MKRIFQIISSVLFICLVPFTQVTAQNRKSEQKIKIISDDGSGSKVVLDTLIQGDNVMDSIRLKTGKVIFINHPDSETDLKNNGDTNQIFVILSDDGKESKKEVKTITITSSDSAGLKKVTKGNKVFVYNSSKEPHGNSRYKIITEDTEREGENDGKIIYIDNGNTSDKKTEKSYSTTVTTGDKGSSVEKTTYVIAKDGMVVTVEGNDEAKAKKLISEIEKKMNALSEGSVKKEVVKTETKKATKK
jgi:hypothetical protein